MKILTRAAPTGSPTFARKQNRSSRQLSPGVPRVGSVIVQNGELPTDRRYRDLPSQNAGLCPRELKFLFIYLFIYLFFEPQGSGGGRDIDDRGELHRRPPPMHRRTYQPHIYFRVP